MMIDMGSIQIDSNEDIVNLKVKINISKCLGRTMDYSRGVWEETRKWLERLSNRETDDYISIQVEDLDY